MSSDEGVEAVDGADTGLDELGRIGARRGVHRLAVYVAVLLGEDLGPAVYGHAHAAEHTAEHIFGHAELKAVPQKAHIALGEVYARGRLEQLDDGLVAVDFEHLAAPRLAGGQLYLGQLVICDALDVFDDHKRAGYLCYGPVFLDHCSSPPAVISAISAAIFLRMSS